MYLRFFFTLSTNIKKNFKIFEQDGINSVTINIKRLHFKNEFNGANYLCTIKFVTWVDVCPGFTFLTSPRYTLKHWCIIRSDCQESLFFSLDVFTGHRIWLVIGYCHQPAATTANHICQYSPWLTRKKWHHIRANAICGGAVFLNSGQCSSSR